MHPVPCHVLDCEEGPVSRQDVVQATHADDRIVRVLNDMLEYTVLSWPERFITGRIVAIRAFKDVGGRALSPVRPNRCIDRGLHVAAIEVDLSSWREIVALIDYSEHVEQMRAGVKDVVDVKARVYFQSRTEDVVEDVTPIGAVCR